MRKRPEASPFICNLDLLIMLGGLPLGLPGLLALMLEGVAGLPIRRECELGRRLTGCASRHCLRQAIAAAIIAAVAITGLRLVRGQRHTFVLG